MTQVRFVTKEKNYSRVFLLAKIDSKLYYAFLLKEKKLNHQTHSMSNNVYDLSKIIQLYVSTFPSYNNVNVFFLHKQHFLLTKFYHIIFENNFFLILLNQQKYGQRKSTQKVGILNLHNM